MQITHKLVTGANISDKNITEIETHKYFLINDLLKLYF